MMWGPRRLHRLAFATLCWCKVITLGVSQDAAAYGDDPIEVDVMLEAAASADPNTPHDKITSACVPEAAQTTWRTEFKSAVETMLQKTRRGMHDGLEGIADSVVKLIEACSCGNNPVLDAMKEQAQRLHVFATSRGMLNMGSKVTYEPMKALTVGGIDVHQEVNELLVAWKLNKGAEEVGRALKKFMEEFKVEEAKTAADEAPAPHEHVAPENSDPHGRSTPRFWRTALNAAFRSLGDALEPVAEDCLDDCAAKDMSDGIEDAFESMLEKTRRSMQAGLKKIASTTTTFFAKVENSCDSLASSAASRRLKGAAE